MHAHQSLQLGLGLEIVVQSFISLFGEVLLQLVDAILIARVWSPCMYCIIPRRKRQDVITFCSSFHFIVEFSFNAHFSLVRANEDVILTQQSQKLLVFLGASADFDDVTDNCGVDLLVQKLLIILQDFSNCRLRHQIVLHGGHHALMEKVGDPLGGIELVEIVFN